MAIPRRRLFAAVLSLLAGVIGWDEFESEPRPVMGGSNMTGSTQNDPSIVDQLFVERSKADLPDPDIEPAVALTEDGIFVYDTLDGWTDQFSMDYPSGGLSVDGDRVLRTEASYDTVTSDISSFGTTRTPDDSRLIAVHATIEVKSSGGTAGEAVAKVDSGDGWSERAFWEANVSAGTLSGVNEVSTKNTEKFYVPPGAEYKFVNVSDPDGANSIKKVEEFSL